MEVRPIKKRGLAALSPERRKEISSLGGQKAQLMGKVHRWNRKEARAAGKKGGATVKERYGREYYVALGKKGAATLTDEDRRHFHQRARIAAAHDDDRGIQLPRPLAEEQEGTG